MFNSKLDKRLFVLGAILVFLAPGLIMTSFYSVKAAQPQPKSAKLAYTTNDYRVYCEEPNGNEIYVPLYNVTAGAAAVTIVPGGCK